MGQKQKSNMKECMKWNNRMHNEFDNEFRVED